VFRRIVFFLLLCASSWPLAAADCAVTRQVTPGDTIPQLAGLYFGDSRFWPSIVLATNSRPKDFHFVSDLDDLRNVPKLCIPEMEEAKRWRMRYEQYLSAIAAAALPEKSEAPKKLVEFPADQPLTVATWIRETQLGQYRNASGWRTTAPSEIWVTVEPWLRKFCREFVAHGNNLDQLIERLEERLGLPPASNKNTFLEIRLNWPSSDVIFRPCLDPATDKTDCPAGPPSAATSEQHLNWIYRQYYSSYGESRLSSFPWTNLGYTFDWAPGSPGGGVFQRVGESEFVIREGAPIEILGEMDTARYCQPEK